MLPPPTLRATCGCEAATPHARCHWVLCASILGPPTSFHSPASQLHLPGLRPGL